MVNPAPSLTKKDTACAMSSGLPVRATGVTTRRPVTAYPDQLWLSTSP